MRAAEAAKNTAGLIDGTVARVGEGSPMVGKTNEAFSEVSQCIARASGLVGEIAVASGEQAQGLEQLNKAMSEMETVTQRIASSSEESAAAAEELSAMSAQMDDYVRELVMMINGAKAGFEGKASRPAVQSVAKKPTQGRVARAMSASPKQKALAVPPRPAPRKVVATKPQQKPEAMIPFEEDNFQDF